MDAQRTTDLAKKLDQKIDQMIGYQSRRLEGWLEDLLNNGRVEVGWRASCGTTDMTHKIYREWLKVIKSLRKDGVAVSEENVKHKNAWATKSGGFWNSIIYSVAA